jgi:hypothetical protein
MNYRQPLLNATARPLPPAPDGETDKGGGGAGWDQTRATLAGGNQERATLLQAYDSPDKLFEKLSAKVEANPDFDWRKAMAGDDAEEYKRLERFTDLATVRQSWREAEKKISEGGRVRVPGDTATPEEKAEWAAAIGVAEKPDAYEITAKPPAEYQVADSEKELLGRLTLKLHEAMSNGARAPDLMNIAHQFYYDEAAACAAAAEDRAIELALDSETELKGLWGGQFKDNVRWAYAGAKTFFPPSSPDKLDQELEEFMGLMLSSGHKLGDHPVFMRMFSQIGRQFAEDPFFQQMRGENAGFDPEKRKAEIMGLKETNPRLYADPKIQAELDRINEGLNRRAQQQGRAA